MLSTVDLIVESNSVRVDVHTISHLDTQKLRSLPYTAAASAQCLLFFRKRTRAVQLGMSALGQKRTSESSNLSVAALGFPLYLQLQNAEAVALLAMASAYERTTSPTLRLWSLRRAACNVSQ